MIRKKQEIKGLKRGRTVAEKGEKRDGKGRKVWKGTEKG